MVRANVTITILVIKIKGYKWYCIQVTIDPLNNKHRHSPERHLDTCHSYEHDIESIDIIKLIYK